MLSVFLGHRQTVDLDVLLCTGFNSEHADLFLCLILTQRPVNDQKIERSNMRCLVGNKFSPIPSNVSFHILA